METKQSLYSKFCGYLDSIGFKYDCDDEKCAVETGVQGDDLPMRFHITFDDEPLRMWMWSMLPAVVRDGKKMAACAIAVHKVNSEMFLGNFDMDPEDGTIGYELTTLFEGCDVEDPQATFGTIVALATSYIDEYNEKIAALAMGMIDLDEFMKKIAD